MKDILLHLVLLVLCLLPNTSLASQSSLSRGSSLSVERRSDILVSPDESYSCGFYQVAPNAYTLSIFFTKSANKTVAWTANRDHPVNGHGSRLTLQKDGNLVLEDVDGTAVWSTDTGFSPADRVELLDSGNLIVKDVRGNVLWQSFDAPTDTLLPTQPITKTTKLVSPAAEGSLASGPYSFFFDNDNVLKLMYNGPDISSIYWPDPDYKVWENGRSNYNSSRFGILNREGQFMASDKLAFSASDIGSGILRRLTLNFDGNLRIHSLSEKTGMWPVTWEALPQQCQVHGLCGRNGICSYKDSETVCSCPPYFEISDQSDWGRGCRPMFNISCDQQNRLSFVEVPQADFWGFDLSYNSSISLEDCMQQCLADCSCQGIHYRSPGDCFSKSSLFNGKKSPGTTGSMYLKVPKDLASSTVTPPLVYQKLACNVEELVYNVTYAAQVDRNKWVAYYSFISAIGFVEILFAVSGLWFVLRKDHMPTSPEEGYAALYSQFRKFTYRELKKATGNFKHELGRGGSGVTYRGVLDGKRDVAVKKLVEVDQSEEEFQAELSLIGRINHMNLIRIWGFCAEGNHRLLVLEYVENGALDKHLFDEHSTAGTMLGWRERYKIATGVAKGLAYLHHECLQWVIHCDVKPENILLDTGLEPKIADFGLAKLSKRGVGISASRMRGTRGYMAPEWASNLPISCKVDVYSFGVVLLELVMGSRVSSLMVDQEEVAGNGLMDLVRTLKAKLEDEDKSWIANLVDFKLNGRFNYKQAETMISISVLCLEMESKERPNMDVILQMLLSNDN